MRQAFYENRCSPDPDTVRVHAYVDIYLFKVSTVYPTDGPKFELFEQVIHAGIECDLEIIELVEIQLLKIIRANYFLRKCDSKTPKFTSYAFFF
jgi:hypothetical protein